MSPARLTVGLGVIHLLATLPAVVQSAPHVLGRGVFGGIATSTPPPPEAVPALAALFSTMLSVELFLIGGLLHVMESAGLSPPRWLGVTFFVSGIVGGLLLPPSGFWLLAALGAWLAFRAPVSAGGGPRPP